MFFTPRENISELEYYNYPSITSFPSFIQLFDAKFTIIAPHIIVVFQLQYAIHVKDAFSINTDIYITWKVYGKNTPSLTLI
jgi:hypothetical protein